MSDKSRIEWTDATWNPVTGCKIVSPGCINCYAMKLAGTRLRHHPSRSGLTIDTKAGAVWNGEVRFNEEWLDQPIRWKKPRRIFVCAHGDLFAEGVEDAWLDKIFAVMACSRQHIFQVLTKRPQRMHDYLRTRMLSHRLAATIGAFDFDVPDELHFPNLPLPHVWLGVSVEDQARAIERIPLLLSTPASVRWISAEPLLGPLNLESIDLNGGGNVDALNIRMWEDEIANWRDSDEDWKEQFLDWYGLADLPEGPMSPILDWVVAGGESGPSARPMHPDWARSIRDHCTAAEVPFFFKQWGEWVPQVGAVDGWSIGDNPEISRFDHRDWEGGQWSEPYRPAWCDDIEDDTVSRIGKRNAGRTLDGREHNDMPGDRHG